MWGHVPNKPQRQRQAAKCRELNEIECEIAENGYSTDLLRRRLEVAELSTGVRFVRDTKDRDGVLAVDSTAWPAFTGAIKDGRLDG